MKYNADENIRTLTVKGLKTRDNTGGDDSIGQVSGYAVVFNQPSEDMGFIEFTSPDAFAGVDMISVLALYDHDYQNILARTDSDTLQLDIDSTGLHFVMDMPNTTLGRDVYENVKNGNLKGMSFGFTIADDDWEQSDDGQIIHTITQIGQLSEISICSLPAYTETSVAVSRKLKSFNEEIYRKKVGLFLDVLNIENKEE